MRRLPVLLVLLAALAVAAVVVLAASSEILVDWLWFRSLGFGAVFATVWSARVAAFGIAALASWIVLVANGLLAARAAGPLVRRLRLVRGNGDPDRLPDTLEISFDRFP